MTTSTTAAGKAPLVQKAPTTALPKGFTTFTDLRPKRRLIVVGVGMTGAGKTDWYLRTAPTPIYYLCLDPNGLEIAKKLVRDGREIYPCSVEFTREMGEAAAKKEWGKCEDAIDAALKANRGSLIIDTATEADELWRLANFGRLEQVSQYKYGDRNKWWKGFFNSAFASDMTVALIHKMKAEYVNDKKTGRFELAGWNGVEFEAQAVVHHEWDEKERVFRLRVTKNNMNAELRGLETHAGIFTYSDFLDETYG